MSIRREDKELIHNLALLGAILGACLCVFGTVHLSKRAYEQSQLNSEYQQTHAALAKLSSPAADPEKVIVDQALLKQVQEQIQQDEPEIQDANPGFWLGLPRWGFWGICGGSCVIGAIAGFSTIWLTGWAGAAFVYYFIRILYKMIRKVAPNSAAAKSIASTQNRLTEQPAFRRDENRILPTLIKLIFLLLLVLSVLGVVVWHLAGI